MDSGYEIDSGSGRFRGGGGELVKFFVRMIWTIVTSQAEMQLCGVFENGVVVECNYNSLKPYFLFIAAFIWIVFGQESVNMIYLIEEVSEFYM